MVDIRTSCFAARLAAFSCPQKHWKGLIFRGALYLSTNLIFFFWYWFIDYPEQLRHLSDPTDLPDILFPEQSGNLVALWKPHPIDYLFFTILCSNTLGPPEGHLVFGRRTKLLQIGHTITTLVVFLVLVARAINTLPARAMTP
jgi:hypothetical protein